MHKADLEFLKFAHKRGHAIQVAAGAYNSVSGCCQGAHWLDIPWPHWEPDTLYRLKPPKDF